MTSYQSRHGRWSPLSILAVVAGFIAWWPLGLAALAYVLWAGPVDGLADEGAKRLRDARDREEFERFMAERKPPQS
jgi:hypothetical protein